MYFIILRNISRNIHRLKPLLIILIAIFLIVFLINSILDYIDKTFESSYVEYLSGEASLAPNEAESFNIFGSNALLVGEYLVPPVFADYESIIDSLLDDSAAIKDSTSIVSSAAQVAVFESKKAQILFGVEFKDYLEFFPGIVLLHGQIPSPGTPGIIIQEELYEQIQKENPEKQILESPALLTVAYDISFTIREVPIVGVFRYPVEDQILDRVAIVDADTARALNGYVYGASEEVDLSDEQNSLLDLDLEDLFGSEDSFVSDETIQNDILGSVDSIFTDKDEFITAQTSVSNAWTMVLLRFMDNKQERRFFRKIKTEKKDLIIRNWRNTVGGNVVIVWFLRILLNAGIIFIITGAVAITINAIVLSVYERTKEIGTMRAIGAQKKTIAYIIGSEVIIVVVGAALIGIILGLIFTVIFNIISIEFDNTFILSMFGGGPLKGVVSFRLVILHIIFAIIIGLVSFLSPLRKALLMEPVKAINK